MHAAASNAPLPILLVDGDPHLAPSFQSLLGGGFHVQGEPDAERGWETLLRKPFALVFLDLRLPGMDGLSLLEKIRTRDASLPVIVLTVADDGEAAARALAVGATDCLVKPCTNGVLGAVVRRALDGVRRGPERPRKAATLPVRFEDIIGVSAVTRSIIEQIGDLSRSEGRVLITGETGTGKDLAARAIHDNSRRRSGPFVPVNCAAVPADLADSLFFGHEKGAFTGALREHRGYFEQADGGTIFLDEVEEMPSWLQAKLLRSLDDGRVTRVGGEGSRRIDARVLAATNRNLASWVAEGRFREDLYHRLNVLRLHLPPLRERREDISLLLDHFLAVISRREGKPIRGFTQVTRKLLCLMDWPGNVRELMDGMERLVFQARGEVIDAREDLLRQVFAPPRSPGTAPANGHGAGSDLESLRAQVMERERQNLLGALARAGGNQSGAADELGITRKTFARRMRAYGIALEPGNGKMTKFHAAPRGSNGA